MASCRTNCTFNRKEREVNRVLFCMYPKMLLKHLFALTVTKNVDIMQLRII